MKEIGKINTEKIARVRELMKEFKRLDEEIRRVLKALLPKGRELGYIEDPFEPYYKSFSEDYIIAHDISPALKQPRDEFEEKQLVVRKDGTVLLMTSEELWSI